MKSLDLLTVTQAAVQYADAVNEARQRRQDLRDGYAAWRQRSGQLDRIQRDSPAWRDMVAATAGEYRQLQLARGRQRRAQTKLLRLARGVQL